MSVLQIMSGLWAIEPKALEQIQAIYDRRIAMGHESKADIEARLGRSLDGPSRGYQMQGNVAVLAITGPIAKRATLFSDISGGVSTSQVGNDLRDALDDPSVATIVLDIDSPGGTVDGTGELADLVYASRAVKPVIAVANGMMASAAVWIGSSAARVYATSGSTVVGSIGVVQNHQDVSAAEATRGIKTTEITAGKYKRIASSYAPLTPEGRATIQDQVDQVYTVFVGSVARGRGVDPDTVEANMAQGRVFIGQQAVDAGLVDGLETLESVVARAQQGEFANLVQEGASAALEDFRMSSKAKPGKGNSALASAIAQALQVPAGTVAVPGLDTIVATLSPTRTGDQAVARAVEPQAPKPGQPAAQATATQSESTMEITVEILKAQHPAIANALIAEGHAAGLTEGRATSATEAFASGGKAERERIQGVLGTKLAGHKALVNTLAFDGKTTPAEAALQVLAAERSRQDVAKGNLQADADALAAVTGAGAPDPNKDKNTQGNDQPSHPNASQLAPKSARELSAKALAYQADQKKAGIDVTIAQAVAHVEKNQA